MMDDEHKELWKQLESDARIEYLYGEAKKATRQIAELYALSRNSLNFEKLEKSIKFWGSLIAATVLLITFLSQAMNYFDGLNQLQKQQLELQERRQEEEHDRYSPAMMHQRMETPYYYYEEYQYYEGEET